MSGSGGAGGGGGGCCLLFVRFPPKKGNKNEDLRLRNRVVERGEGDRERETWGGEWGGGVGGSSVGIVFFFLCRWESEKDESRAYERCHAANNISWHA